jgi:hypothetical protein
MGDTPDRDVQEVIDWWRRYGFKRGECEYADAHVLFGQLLEKMDELSLVGQLQVLDWIDKNGW